MAADSPSPNDNEPSRCPRGLRPTTLWGVALLVLAISLIGGGNDFDQTPPRPAQAAHAGAEASPGLPKAAGKHLPRSKPKRLFIPKISVDAPFTDLAIGASGQLQAPPANDTNLVGWHAEGPSPGEAGTSIIAGHVDTATSAAVFASLRELKKGDRFSVLRADGRKAEFVVDSVETFDKDRFPNDRVYADTPQAQVRLITCAGDYDRAVKDYTENLVVFAHLV